MNTLARRYGKLCLASNVFVAVAVMVWPRYRHFAKARRAAFNAAFDFRYVPDSPEQVLRMALGKQP